MSQIWQKNETKWGQRILPGIIKKWLNRLCNPSHHLSLCSILPSTSSPQGRRERTSLWAVGCWERMSTVTFPSSPFGREKGSCCFPNPPNVKRDPNIILKDVECLNDTLFLIWSCLYSALADHLSCSYMCKGERNGEMRGQRECKCVAVCTHTTWWGKTVLSHLRVHK